MVYIPITTLNLLRPIDNCSHCKMRNEPFAARIRVHNGKLIVIILVFSGSVMEMGLLLLLLFKTFFDGFVFVKNNNLSSSMHDQAINQQIYLFRVAS
jgi:hypothetical protein